MYVHDVFIKSHFCIFHRGDNSIDFERLAFLNQSLKVCIFSPPKHKKLCSVAKVNNIL